MSGDRAVLINGNFECGVTRNAAKLKQLTASVPAVSRAVGIADMSFTVCISVGRRLYLALLRSESW